MHIRLIVVGDRQPAWVGEAFEKYRRRMPRHWQFRLDVIGTARRAGAAETNRAVVDESRRVLQKISSSEQVVLLDEEGLQLSSAGLAERLRDWQAAGCDLSFVIGGPDGVSRDCRQRADFRWSLSKLTLPHGLARIVVVEQLYRAWTLTTGHPYHRA